MNLKMRHQNHELLNPMGKDFNYAQEFKTIDLNELKKDVKEVLTTWQEWWLAD